MPHSTADTAPAAPVVRDDPRHPLYLGFWKRSAKAGVTAFARDDFEEPHRKRRQAILDRHPEVKELYGNEPLTAVIAAVAVALQLAAAYLVGCVWTDLHWAAVVAIAYLLGGSVSALYGVIIHEAGHNLVFEAPLGNRLTGLL
ncbi:sphingolipid delta-4 desaturase, partial [Coemansia spiralis]